MGAVGTRSRIIEATVALSVVVVVVVAAPTGTIIRKWFAEAAVVVVITWRTAEVPSPAADGVDVAVLAVVIMVVVMRGCVDLIDV